ncbi:uncharacterized protein LOC142888321 isoform X3 [Nelusetta ayraudi]|uniref:uncharacterized protein LOC142888321 isoform X3 n=1 Tax=Nelusetta ayraudi TaxID=303726 RepID=UPI003F6E5833
MITSVSNDVCVCREREREKERERERGRESGTTLNNTSENHLKMMRLLFLCLLLLPAATGVSQPNEGSADGDMDDEDLNEELVIPKSRADQGHDMHAGKTVGTEDSSDQLTMIVIIVAVAALTLSIGAIVTIMLVRRHMQHRQQGRIYTVPIEQRQKGV